MGKITNIAWCDHTFSTVWGCSLHTYELDGEIVGEQGCVNCYAKALAQRWGHDLWQRHGARRVFGGKHWKEPLAWNKAAEKEGVRRRVFCGSMCDWAEDHPVTNGQLPALFDLILKTQTLDWLLLTKRADRIEESIITGLRRNGSQTAIWRDSLAYPNIWMGVSVSEEKGLWRVDALKKVPATVRFISYEPALGPIAHKLDLTGIHQVIYGGESGPGFRKDDFAWAKDVFDLCRNSGVAFFYKQQAARLPGNRNEHPEMPQEVPSR
jgi:protein gp37